MITQHPSINVIGFHITQYLPMPRKSPLRGIAFYTHPTFLYTYHVGAWETYKGKHKCRRKTRFISYDIFNLNFLQAMRNTSIPRTKIDCFTMDALEQIKATLNNQTPQFTNRGGVGTDVRYLSDFALHQIKDAIGNGGGGGVQLIPQ